MIPRRRSDFGGESSRASRSRKKPARRRSCHPRRLPARCCKCINPEKARSHLEPVLASKPEPEGFWLLSRAYLQEGSKDQALQHWKSPTRSAMRILSSPSHRLTSVRIAVPSVIRRSFKLSRLAARPHVLSGRRARQPLAAPESFADPAKRRSRTRSGDRAAQS